jgi:hypothetical protein
MAPRFVNFAASLLATMAAGSVQAHQIDASTFDPSLSNEVSFASLPLNFGRRGPVVAEGITFTSGSGSLRTYPADSFSPLPGLDTVVCAEKGCIMTDTDLDYIAVRLPNPVSMVGAYLGITNSPTTAVAEFYSGMTLLGSVNVSARSFEGVFAGWHADSPIITSVKFIDNESQDFVLALSGFTYQGGMPIPEPSTFFQTLGALCLAAVVSTGRFFRRRKR